MEDVAWESAVGRGKQLKNFPHFLMSHGRSRQIMVSHRFILCSSIVFSRLYLLISTCDCKPSSLPPQKLRVIITGGMHGPFNSDSCSVHYTNQRNISDSLDSYHSFCAQFIFILRLCHLLWIGNQYPFPLEKWNVSYCIAWLAEPAFFLP